MNENLFWEIIKDLEWDGDYSYSAQILIHKVETKEIEDPQGLYNYFKHIKKLINQETLRRVENNLESFEDHIEYGGDDCHFIDLPEELIGRGKIEVSNYLDGELVPFEARQSFGAIFYPLLDKGIIKDL